MGAAEKPTFDANTMLVTMTRDELRALVSSVVREALGKNAETPDYLTLSQAAELMQVHERTIRNWVTREGLPALRAGGEYRFRRESIIAWLDARAALPGAHISKHTDRAKRMR